MIIKDSKFILGLLSILRGAIMEKYEINKFDLKWVSDGFWKMRDLKSTLKM